MITLRRGYDAMAKFDIKKAEGILTEVTSGAPPVPRSPFTGCFLHESDMLVIFNFSHTLVLHWS
jgi:hypothetical protein